MIRMPMAALAAATMLAAAGFAGQASAEAVLGASQTASVAAVLPNLPSPGGSANGGYLTVNYIDASENYGLLQFDLSGEAGTASAAAVFLHHVNNVVASADFGLFRVTSAWDASSVTFNTAPTFDLTPVSTRHFTTLNGPDELEAFDVTAVVNGWLSGAYANYGLAFRRIDDVNPELYFAAADQGSLRGPVLSVIGTTTRAVGGVPEPATWGLMILGFGAAGGALRRSRRVAA
jgi:hypothetical protein